MIIGHQAGQNLTDGSDNIYIGASAGASADNEGGTISIGHQKLQSACFSAGISTNFQPVGDNVVHMTINPSTGQIGWNGSSNNASAPLLPSTSVPGGGVAPHDVSLRPAAAECQATVNDKVEKLQATVAQQEKQIDRLTAQLREQAAQIQRVSAQLQMSKAAPQTVFNHE
jgi:hypothetical protein